MTSNFTGWRKSTRSGNQSNCVEVGVSTDGRLIGVRDSKDRAAGHLAVSTSQWASFVASLHSGDVVG